MEIIETQPKLEASNKGAFKLTQLLYNVDWDQHYPLVLSQTAQVEHVSFFEIEQFILENIKEISQKTERAMPFPAEGITPKKKSFYTLAADCFAFKHQNMTVGYFIGNPVDWRTYYLRSTYILKNYRSLGFYKNHLMNQVNILKTYGIERIIAEISPSNPKQIEFLCQRNFKIIGTLNSEQWGLLVQLVSYLNPVSENHFLERFCAQI